MQPNFIFTINDFNNNLHEPPLTIKTTLKYENMNIVTVGDISILCNGCIYNESQLFNILQIKPITNYPEYEIIIWLYKKYGIINTLQLLDGVFSFILVDNNIYNENFKIIITRDVYGANPLYFITNNNNNTITFSNNINEIKKTDEINITNFLPGSYTEYNLSSKVFSKWIIKNENCKYYHNNMSRNLTYEPTYFINTVKSNLIQTVKKICDYLLNKKCIFTCILNEHITSTLLIWSICEYYKNINVENIQINTCCIGNEQCHINNRNVINNLKQQYLLNICYTEVLIENDENNMTPLFIKIKETKNINYIFSDLGALELFYKKGSNIIDYKCNIKDLLENIHIKLSLMNNICNFYNLTPIFPFFDKPFIENIT